jgi:NDP-sugar pyrophosphorylase family protein
LPPRPLLPIAHRPLLSYSLSWLRDGGVREATVCANRETQVLESRLHRHVPHGLRVSYNEDRMPRGAAGAIRDASETTNAKVLVVTDGTSIPTVDLSELLAYHEASGSAVTVVAHIEEGRHGKPALQVPTGTYVFNRSALAKVPERGFCDIKENLIPQLHRAKESVGVYAVTSPSPRVLDAPSYRAVNEWMVDHLITTRTVPDGYVLSGSTLIHREASVACDATFVGPVLVGPGAQIASGAVSVGPTSIGRDVVVGRDVLVSRSAIWRRSVLHDHVVADRCILADASVVASATRVFGQVMTSSHGELDTVRESASLARETASFEFIRRMGRAVFPNAAWTRYPAAQ